MNLGKINQTYSIYTQKNFYKEEKIIRGYKTLNI